MAVFSFLFKPVPADSQPESIPKESGEAELNHDGASDSAGTPPLSQLEASVETKQPSTEPSSNVSSAVEVLQVISTEVSTGASSPDVKVNESAPAGPPQSNVQVQRSFSRGFSFHSLAFLSNRSGVKPALSSAQENEKKTKVLAAFFQRQAKVPGPKTRGKQSALVVRSLIVGTLPISSPGATQVVSKSELNKVKSQLIQPKSANEVIAQLRTLPHCDGNAVGEGERVDGLQVKPAAPIHAVCLDTTDKEAEKRHFSQLIGEGDGKQVTAESNKIPSVASASVEMLSKMFKGMKVVDLVNSPDFGLGHGDGILSGAVPTAETVINDIEQVTPQLTGMTFMNSMWPSHNGVYPPTDRMSVLTYWWGLELVLPDSSIQYLSTVESIAQTVMNILTAMSVMVNGVREILPFIRYISQFVDFEFNMIKKQNHGQGVVCAATWIMPAAMVPRPWDFAAPPPKPVQDSENKIESTVTESTDLPRSSQETSSTAHPRPSNVTVRSQSTIGSIPSLPPVLPEVVINTPNGTVNPVHV